MAQSISLLRRATQGIIALTVINKMTYAIIGAGIGGLTMGLAFQKFGIDFKIYEKFPKIKNVGAGIGLSPNALQVFEHLGILDEVRKKGNSIERIIFAQPNLTPISDNPQNEVKAKFGYSAIAIHRAELQKILLNRFHSRSIILGKEFEFFSTNKNSKIESLFSDGTYVHSEYLIGADGINSKVRNQLFPNSKVRYSGQTCWRGISLIKLNSEFDHRVYELWGNQVRFGFSRISEDNYYWFAVSLDKPKQKDNPNDVKPKLLKMFNNFHPVITKLISNTPNEEIIRNDITDLKPLINWHQNNICLIGDACHATTPNMGQGAAQAIEDAYYLSNLQNTKPYMNVFNQFQKKRQSKVNSIVNQSFFIGRIAHLKYAQGLRNIILKKIPRKLLMKEILKLYQIEKYYS